MYKAEVYAELLTETLPGTIETLDEYNRVEAIFAELFDRERSPEQNRLFDLLALLLEDFERRTLSPTEKPSPLETLRFLMRENDLQQKDVVDIFGSQSVASEVLSGKRNISKTHAHRLAERFKLSLNAFI